MSNKSNWCLSPGWEFYKMQDLLEESNYWEKAEACCGLIALIWREGQSSICVVFLSHSNNLNTTAGVMLTTTPLDVASNSSFALLMRKFQTNKGLFSAMGWAIPGSDSKCQSFHVCNMMIKDVILTFTFLWDLVEPVPSGTFTFKRSHCVDTVSSLTEAWDGLALIHICTHTAYR